VIEKANVATPLYEAFPGLKGESHGLAEALQYDTRHRPPVAFDATSEEMIVDMFRARACLLDASNATCRSDENWHQMRASGFLDASPARVLGLAWLEGHQMGRIDGGLPMERHKDTFPIPRWEIDAAKQIAGQGPWSDGDDQLLDLAVINRTAYFLNERLYYLGGRELVGGGRLWGGGVAERLCGLGHHEGDYMMALEFLNYALERLLTASHPANEPDTLRQEGLPTQEQFLNLIPRDAAGAPVTWEATLAEALGREAIFVELDPEPTLKGMG
jgi:hypothetical protein